MTPAIQSTLTTALRHWFGDAQGEGARTFRDVSLATWRLVRQDPDVQAAAAYVEIAARGGNVPATEAACQTLTLVYKRALRQCREIGAA